MILRDSQIKLRAVEPEDLDILYHWENITHLWSYGNTLSPYSKLMLRQYINDAMEMDIYQSKQLRLMICLLEDETTIGTVDLYDIDVHHSRSGIGILIDEEYRQKKYATSALKLMADYAFGFLHLHQLYAYIAISNIASKCLFEKAGYEEIGCLKDWIQKDTTFENVHLYQLLNDKQR